MAFGRKAVAHPVSQFDARETNQQRSREEEKDSDEDGLHDANRYPTPRTVLMSARSLSSFLRR